MKNEENLILKPIPVRNHNITTLLLSLPLSLSSLLPSSEVLVVLRQRGLLRVLVLLLHLGLPLRVHLHLGRQQRRHRHELKVGVADQLPRTLQRRS